MSSLPRNKYARALSGPLPTAHIDLSSSILRKRKVVVQYKHKRLSNVKRDKMTRSLSRNSIRQALRLARAARASITAKKVAYAVKIEEVEQYLGFMRSQHLILEQREADADEKIGDVRDVLDQNSIPELSYSDSDDYDDEEESIALTYPPSSDVTFSDLHHIEATDDSDLSDASGEGKSVRSEAPQEVTSCIGTADLAIDRSSMHAPHAVTMVAEPSEGPSCGSTQWVSVSKVGSTSC